MESNVVLGVLSESFYTIIKKIACIACTKNGHIQREREREIMTHENEDAHQVFKKCLIVPL